MKQLVPLLAVAFAATALAQTSTCSSEAAARKLTGSAKAEFLRSCAAKARTPLATAPKDGKMSSAPAPMSLMPTRGAGECGHSQADL